MTLTLREVDLNEYSRQNRSSMTSAERLLWSHLRGRRQGFKFRSQQPIGTYIVDFYCAERRVAIELDGSSHVGMEEYDSGRDAALTCENIAVLRFTNEVVEASVEGVVAEIRRECESRPFFRF